MAEQTDSDEELTAHLADLDLGQDTLYSRLNHAGKARYAWEVHERGPGVERFAEYIRAAANDHNIAATRQELSKAEQATFDLYGYEDQLDMSTRMRRGQSASAALDEYGREHGVPVARERFTDLEGFERAYQQARGDILEANGVDRDAPATRLKNGSVVLWGRTGADSPWTRVTDTNLTDMRSHVRASQDEGRWEYQVRPADEPRAPAVPSRVEHEPPAAEQRVASTVATHFREFRQTLQREPRQDAESMRPMRMESAAQDVFTQSLGDAWSESLGEYADRIQVDAGLAGNSVLVFLSDAEGSMDSTVTLEGVYGRPRFAALYGEDQGGSELVEARTGVPADRIDAIAPALVEARREAREAVARFPPSSRAERLNRRETATANAATNRASGRPEGQHEMDVPEFVSLHLGYWARQIQKGPGADTEAARRGHMEQAADNVFTQSLDQVWDATMGDDADKLQADVGLVGDRVSVMLSDADGSMDSTVTLENTGDGYFFEALYGDETGGSELVEARTGVAAGKVDEIVPALETARDDARRTVTVFPSARFARQVSAQLAGTVNHSAHDATRQGPAQAASTPGMA